MSTITTTSELEALYGAPVETSLVKEANRITSHYRTMIEASPFVALATSGPEGLDCSPRGDMAGFVRIHDETTVMIPDRRGNNRVDSLRNIVRDPKVALLFLLPGSGNTLRINGRAHLSIDPDLLASFAIDAHAPRSVIVIEVETIYFQCARAIIRAELWNPERHIAAGDLPTPGEIISDMTDNRLGGKDYD
ncbi:MAG: pyridoxamine 5'-phosphate oxidase family protein, partial [Alphaproteobacteria bacterium]